MPGIVTQQTRTRIDPVTKTVYGKIKIGVANNIYDKLFNDDDTKPTVYKTSWILDSVASGQYIDNETVMQNKKKIQPSTGIEVGCANTDIMHQKGERKLPFNNIPDGTDVVNIIHKMHSPLLSGRKFIKEGKCTLVFGRKNTYVVKGHTREQVQQIMKKVEEKNSDDIVMTVPFDEKTLTWKTDANGQAKLLFNVARNVHRIRSKEILCDYLHQAAGYPVKKTWLQAI